MTLSKKQKGFTLIELIMVIVILSIISVVAGRFLLQAYQSFITSNRINELNIQSNLALNRITNDIHNIRSSSDITTMTASALSFVDSNGNSVQYAVSGSNLLRSGITLINNLSSIAFTYYDVNGTTASIASALVYIKVTLTVSNGSITQTFITSVGRRNFG